MKYITGFTPITIILEDEHDKIIFKQILDLAYNAHLADPKGRSDFILLEIKELVAAFAKDVP